MCLTQILVVLLIGWNFLSTNQKHYQDLVRDTLPVWNFWSRYSGVILQGLKWRPRETSAVSQARFNEELNSINVKVYSDATSMAVLA